MGPLGLPEILFILVLALLVFGPKRLPEMGRTVGKALGEFRKATTELKRSINVELALDDDEKPSRPRASSLEPVVRPAEQALEDGADLPAPAAVESGGDVPAPALEAKAPALEAPRTAPAGTEPRGAVSSALPLEPS